MHRQLLSFGIVVAGLLLLAAPEASAQQAVTPTIPLEMFDNTLHLDSDELTMCLNMSSAMVGFDRAVGTAIADALLLKVKFHEIVYPSPVPGDFRIPLNERQLFAAMHRDCDAFIGFRASPGSLPEWMTVTAPYYISHMIFMTKNPAYRAFADIPAGEQIGVRLGSTGHRQMMTYLQALPTAQRARQIPYPDNAVLLDRLKDGSVSTIFIWELAPAYLTDGRVADLGVAAEFDPPFAVEPLQFAIGLLKENTYLRSLLDEAIQELTTDGTFAEIAKSNLPSPTID